jgi:hypothetical protein
MAGLGAAAVVGLVVTLTTSPSAASTDRPPRRPQQISAADLADRVVAAPWTVRILDLRGEAAWTAARVPGSEPAARADLARLGLGVAAAGPDLVIVDAGTVATLPAEVAAYRGRVLALRGGFAAWSRHALQAAPVPGAGATDEERSRWARREALRSMLTGQAAAPPPPRPVRAVGPRPATGGGCQ